jgi:plastocyanin
MSGASLSKGTRRGLALAALLFVLLVPRVARAGYSPGGEKETVEEKDDFFDPEAIHVPIGTTIDWKNAGRNPHTVTADDGSFESGNQDPGSEYSFTFPAAGAYSYYCRYHGAAGGIGMAGVILVGDAELPSGSGGTVSPGREQVPTEPGVILRVPKKYATIQSAVDAAKPGDLILVSPGIYNEAVRVTTPYLTIRGTDRNGVILDGEFKRPNGIHVIEADGVSIENMTARHYLLNGFYWTTVFGYKASYLTAYDNGDYGLYAFDSVYGRFEHSYASGHPDSGFYIGQCYPCHAVIDDVVAEGNALGYSGTNAGGDLKIVNSVWRNNMSGIVPNTLDSELLAPQREVYIAGNLVEDNNNLHAPAKDLQYPSIGTGILLAGGVGNIVEHNTVLNHHNYGIAVFPNIDENFWIAERNLVRDNYVRGSGRADLVLSGPAGKGNCFSGNDFQSSLPPAIQAIHGCGFGLNRLGGGDLSAAIQTLALFIQAQAGNFPKGDWRAAPAPPAQETMPEPSTQIPDPAVPEIGVPGPTAENIARPASPTGQKRSQEVTVLGISIAAPTWWGLLLATYAYLLPLILYVAWVSIGIWDIVRREQLRRGRQIGWMAVLLLVPFLGPILYFVAGRSPIPASLRTMLVAGGLGIYLVVAVAAIVIGS